MNFPVLGADRLGRQVSEEKTRVGPVGETNTSSCAQSKRMAAIDSLELVALGSAMGEGREDQNARHEAEGSGRQGVYGLERERVL